MTDLFLARSFLAESNPLLVDRHALSPLGLRRSGGRLPRLSLSGPKLLQACAGLSLQQTHTGRCNNRFVWVGFDDVKLDLVSKATQRTKIQYWEKISGSQPEYDRVVPHGTGYHRLHTRQVHLTLIFPSLLCSSSCVNRPDAVWYFARRAEKLTGTLRRRRACACPPPPSSPPLGPLWKPFPAEPSPRARVPPGCVSLALPPAAEADCRRTNTNEMQIVRAFVVQVWTRGDEHQRNLQKRALTWRSFSLDTYYLNVGISVEVLLVVEAQQSSRSESTHQPLQNSAPSLKVKLSLSNDQTHERKKQSSLAFVLRVSRFVSLPKEIRCTHESTLLASDKGGCPA